MRWAPGGVLPRLRLSSSNAYRSPGQNGAKGFECGLKTWDHGAKKREPELVPEFMQALARIERKAD